MELPSNAGALRAYYHRYARDLAVIHAHLELAVPKAFDIWASSYSGAPEGLAGSTMGTLVREGMNLSANGPAVPRLRAVQDAPLRQLELLYLTMGPNRSVRYGAVKSPTLRLRKLPVNWRTHDEIAEPEPISVYRQRTLFENEIEDAYPMGAEYTIVWRAAAETQSLDKAVLAVTHTMTDSSVARILDLIPLPDSTKALAGDPSTPAAPKPGSFDDFFRSFGTQLPSDDDTPA